MIWNDFWLLVIVHVKGRCERQLWKLWSPWPIFHRPLWKDNLCGTDGEKMEWGKNKLEKNPTKIIKGGNREKRRGHGPGSLKPLWLGLETSHMGCCIRGFALLLQFSFTFFRVWKICIPSLKNLHPVGANARNVSFETLYGGQNIVNLVDKTKIIMLYFATDAPPQFF